MRYDRARGNGEDDGQDRRLRKLVDGASITPHRFPGYLEAARNQVCVRCGADDGTVVAAHYTGLRQHIYGKGQGIKVTDLAVADLCGQCHVQFDNVAFHKSVEDSEEFLHCILLTIFSRVDRGRLVPIERDRKHVASGRLSKQRAKRERAQIHYELRKDAIRRRDYE